MTMPEAEATVQTNEHSIDQAEIINNRATATRRMHPARVNTAGGTESQNRVSVLTTDTGAAVEQTAVPRVELALAAEEERETQDDASLAWTDAHPLIDAMLPESCKKRK